MQSARPVRVVLSMDRGGRIEPTDRFMIVSQSFIATAARRAFLGLVLAVIGLLSSSMARADADLPPAPEASESAAVNESSVVVVPTANVDSLGCEDQVWLISTRRLSCRSAGSSNPNWEIHQLERGRTWSARSAEEFYASDDPTLLTVFMVHGNDQSPSEAVERGMLFYRRVVQPMERRVRYVIWSWPSDKQAIRPKLDALAKLPRTNLEPSFLAPFIARIRSDVPVGVVGYSYGARVLAGTLHMLGGGRIEGRSVPVGGDSRRIRAVLIAAAVGRDSLLPGQRFGKALSQVDRVLVTMNPLDRVLKFFPLVSEGRDIALGRLGPVLAGLPSTDRSKVSALNVQPIVRHKHEFSVYMSVPSIMASIRRELATTSSMLCAVPTVQRTTLQVASDPPPEPETGMFAPPAETNLARASEP